MLRYFINEDIGADILAALRKMLKHKMSMIRRKSLFVMFNIYQQFPHLVEDIREIVLNAFNDPETPVAFGALSLLKRLIDSDHLPYKPHTQKFIDIF
jgi:vesicle coat complex subunit